jgi:hypothetical protein
MFYACMLPCRWSSAISICLGRRELRIATHRARTHGAQPRKIRELNLPRLVDTDVICPAVALRRPGQEDRAVRQAKSGSVQRVEQPARN